MRPSCSTSRYRLVLVLLGLMSGPRVLADGMDEIDDVAARIQYSFYTADVRGIEDALGIVAKVELPASSKGLKEYYSAFAHWKLAELHAKAAAAGTKDARSRASKAADACKTAAEQAVALDPRMGEAYAIEAACSSLGGGPLSVGGGCAKHKSLRTALEIEPANPRIRFIEAQCLAQAEKTPSPGSLQRAKSVVDAFESARPSKPGQPDWGHAEALLALGKLEAARGNKVEARDIIEKALVIAPDYREAQVLLKQTGPR